MNSNIIPCAEIDVSVESTTLKIKYNISDAYFSKIVAVLNSSTSFHVGLKDVMFIIASQSTVDRVKSENNYDYIIPLVRDGVDREFRYRFASKKFANEVRNKIINVFKKHSLRLKDSLERRLVRFSYSKCSVLDKRFFKITAIQDREAQSLGIDPISFEKGVYYPFNEKNRIKIANTAKIRYRSGNVYEVSHEDDICKIYACRRITWARA